MKDRKIIGSLFVALSLIVVIGIGILGRGKLGSGTSSVSRGMSGIEVVNATVTLGWNPNLEPDISGYKLYTGTTSHVYGAPVNVGNVTTATIDLVPGSTYFFAISAVNTAQMEGLLSNEISYRLIVPSPTPSQLVNISGSIPYCLGGVTAGVTVASDTGQMTLSGSDGTYSLSLPVNGSYIVTPSKQGSSGINTLDLVAVQQHYFGQVFLTGCQLESADVDGSGTVDTVDLIAIQRFFLGLSEGIGRTGQYHFTPIQVIYSHLVTNQIQNYAGLVFGDVIVN